MGPLRVKFWGTRGLVSSPRPETAIFGGNTPSIQILHGNQLILVDTGFGCANLGDELISRIVQGGENLEIHIFYTHFHWDHIQGLPFFKPIYFPGTKLHLYSPEPTAATLDNLDILFDGSYSPFESLLSMQASIEIHSIKKGLDLGGLAVDFHTVDHGIDLTALSGEETYAYKFTDTESKASICLITDHEARQTQRNKALVRWAKGTDLLIHDGQYLDDEYVAHMGWGHSSVNQALENALKIAPRMTLLTHHDPGRNDKDLQALHRSLMQLGQYRQLNFEFAREEIVYEAVQARALKTPA